MTIDSMAFRAPPPALGQAIARAAEATGVDFATLAATAARESAFDPNARARTSSATGLFQFIDSTWLDVVRRHGAAHGLPAADQIELRNGRPHIADPAVRQAILDLRTDPGISARMAAELTRENATVLERGLGRPVTGGEVYAAHVLGAGGALRLIRAAEAGAPDASALFPREAAANKGLFFASGEPRSAQSLLARFGSTGGGGQALGGAPTPAIDQAAASLPPNVPTEAVIDVAAFFNALFGPVDEGDADPLFALAAYRRTSP